jgi:hypothetical protein
VRSMKKNSLFTPMPYALTWEAHTTESCLRMLIDEVIATLTKSAQVLWRISNDAYILSFLLTYSMEQSPSW